MSTIAQECNVYANYLRSIYNHADDHIYLHEDDTETENICGLKHFIPDYDPNAIHNLADVSFFPKRSYTKTVDEVSIKSTVYIMLENEVKKELTVSELEGYGDDIYMYTPLLNITNTGLVTLTSTFKVQNDLTAYDKIYVKNEVRVVNWWDHGTYSENIPSGGLMVESYSLGKAVGSTITLTDTYQLTSSLSGREIATLSHTNHPASTGVLTAGTKTAEKTITVPKNTTDILFTCSFDDNIYIQNGGYIVSHNTIPNAITYCSVYTYRLVYDPAAEHMEPVNNKNLANISELLSVLRVPNHQPIDQTRRISPTEHDLTRHTNNYAYWLQKAWDELILYLGYDPGCAHNLKNLKDQIIANVR